ncbi:MAG: tyrosine-protein phosphatase [Chloroflexi bacterium]|nr:tyrosine-protein phosphatase [Chloroflexota bacterium]
MKSSDLHFVQVGNGRMALTHRPRGMDFSMFRGLGCTHIVTLLKESEGAQSIGKMAQNAGLTWVWVPVPNGNHPEGEVHQRLMEALPHLSQLLDEGASLLMHCSAGIHRTGTVAYGLLRWRGISQEDALKLIGQMRTVTHDEMGQKRLCWGNEIARDLPEKRTAWIDSVREFITLFWRNIFKMR